MSAIPNNNGFSYLPSSPPYIPPSQYGQPSAYPGQYPPGTYPGMSNPDYSDLSGLGYGWGASAGAIPGQYPPGAYPGMSNPNYADLSGLGYGSGVSEGSPSSLANWGTGSTLSSTDPGLQEAEGLSGDGTNMDFSGLDQEIDSTEQWVNQLANTPGAISTDGLGTTGTTTTGTTDPQAAALAQEFQANPQMLSEMESNPQTASMLQQLEASDPSVAALVQQMGGTNTINPATQAALTPPVDPTPDPSTTETPPASSASS